ncbi:MAG: hypothetical protein WB770_04260 [Acidimicrobiales bacterium]
MPIDGSVDPTTLLDLISGAVAIPSPAGSELALAEWFAERIESLDPKLKCELDRFAPGRANLVCRDHDERPGGLVVYSHLDTSLSGDPVFDRAITASDSALGFAQDGDTLTGPGVAVAKGPAVAAVLAFILARQLLDTSERASATLLLAAGGTHRAAPRKGTTLPGAPARGAGDGARQYLRDHRPDAALVAKAGPPGVLYEEPGFAYFVVEISGPSGLVMARSEAVRDGGAPAAAGAAVRGVERFRSRFIERTFPENAQAGREVGVGSLSSGAPYKADLIGGLLELYVYVVLAPGDDPANVRTEIETAVAESIVEDGRDRFSVRAMLLDSVTAARTDPASLVVEIAEYAWQSAHGASSPRLHGWTGSSDGVLFRASGVETVRLGPPPIPAGAGVEALSLRELVVSAELYAEIVVRFAQQGNERASK